jgi:hypothetical protein
MTNTIQSDYAKHTNKWNLVDADLQPEDKSRVSDNPIRFTAQFVRALHINGKLGIQECAEITAAIRECEKYPGLYDRYPFREKQESHDDYRGLAVISYYCDRTISERILYYGRSQQIRYTYDNTSDAKFSHLLQKEDNPWLGRFPSMIAMHKIVIGERLNCVYLKWLKRDINGSSLTQDGLVFIWMLRLVMGHIPELKEAFDEWELRVRTVYPDGVGQVLEAYYGHKHPDGIYLKGDFGK